MAVKKRGLGRGLDALMANVRQEVHTGAQVSGEERLASLPVELVRRGQYQPREDMRPEALEDLAASIRAQGVVQPIVVRPVTEGQYEIVAGERRWRAAQMAGLHEIPAVVRNVPDQAALAMALIENIQRENLNPMEESRALKRLLEEFELTHQEVAEAVGRSRAAVTNLLRLGELDEVVRDMLASGQIEMGHARAMLALPGERQVDLARRIVSRGLSVREVEQWVRREKRTGDKTGKASGNKPPLDPDILQLQDELAQRLGAGVRFQHKASGKGSLVIEYNDLDQLEGILSRIN